MGRLTLDFGLPVVLFLNSIQAMLAIEHHKNDKLYILLKKNQSIETNLLPFSFEKRTCRNTR